MREWEGQVGVMRVNTVLCLLIAATSTPERLSTARRSLPWCRMKSTIRSALLKFRRTASLTVFGVFLIISCTHTTNSK